MSQYYHRAYLVATWLSQGCRANLVVTGLSQGAYQEISLSQGCHRVVAGLSQEFHSVAWGCQVVTGLSQGCVGCCQVVTGLSQGGVWRCEVVTGLHVMGCHRVNCHMACRLSGCHRVVQGCGGTAVGMVFEQLFEYSRSNATMNAFSVHLFSKNAFLAVRTQNPRSNGRECVRTPFEHITFSLGWARPQSPESVSFRWLHVG